MIEVRYILDENISQALVAYQMREQRKIWLILSALLFVLGLALVFLYVYYGIVLMLMGILFYPAIMLLLKKGNKEGNKSNQLISSYTQSFYRFSEHKIFNEDIKGEEYRCMSELSYSQVFSAIETDTHFFVYISTMQAHVIPKSAIVVGTSEQLSYLLLTRLGEKFKRKLSSKSHNNQ